MITTHSKVKFNSNHNKDWTKLNIVTSNFNPGNEINDWFKLFAKIKQRSIDFNEWN